MEVVVLAAPMSCYLVHPAGRWARLQTAWGPMQQLEEVAG